MSPTRRAAMLMLLVIASLFAAPMAWAQIDLGWERIDTPQLPPSITVYRSTANLPSGSPIRAFYAAIDLDDPSLEIDVTYVGDGGARITPVDEMNASDEPVYVATNGSFFGTTTSVVPIVDGGQILAFGQQGIARNGATYYPTWGVWGLNGDRESEVLWGWGAPGENAIYAYEEPYPNSLLELPLPVPTLVPPFPTAPDGRAIPEGRIWDAVEAMGGTPVLIKNGVLLDLDETPTASCALDPNITICNELVNDPGLTGVNPRTAIGVTADRKTLILLVVDGRSSDSVGTTIKQTGEILFALGAYDGLNLDGGGSSTIIVNDFDGVLQAPASGNGGNSADVLNTPSDGFMRPVAMSLLIKRLPLFFDALPGSPNYQEIGSGWFSSSNPGAYPDASSPTRLAPAIGAGNVPTNEALFALGGIQPAEYELGAWWVAGSNRATNTPFSIERAGFAPIVVRRDQTGGGSQFNLLGTFHLSAADIVRITNDADGAFVAADALRLRRVGESVPALSFSTATNVTTVPGDTVVSTVTIASPNSGVRPTSLTVYKSVDGGAETILDEVTYGGDQLVETYELSYFVEEAAGSRVALRFEVRDNLDHVVSSTLDIRVLEYIVEFDPAVLPTEQPAGRPIAFDVIVESVDPAVTLTSLQILLSTNGADAEVLQTIPLSGTSETVPFSYLVENDAGDELTFTYRLTGSDGKTAEAVYTADIVPLRGDFVLGFVSDMNGSFGATTYDASIRDSFTFFVNLGVDAVLSGGDMVAGQCASSSACDEPAMWAGFDAELYSQLKAAAIPFLFTLQNHDAANPWDIEAALDFWFDPANIPMGQGLRFVDDSDYPRNYSAVIDFDLDGSDDIFFVAGFNPGDDLNPTELALLDASLATPEAQAARLRVVAAGQPLYAVSAPRNTAGFVTGPRDAITKILRERNVNFYMSGDSAAYYPGKRFGIQLLSLAEMAGTGKAYIGESQVPPTAITRADIFVDDPYYGRNAIVFTTYDKRNDFQIVRKKELPTALFGFDDEFVMRDDVPVTNAGSAQLSSLNLTEPFASGATGSATMTIDNGTVQIEGSFANLDSPLLEAFDAVALYRGRNGDDGVLLQLLEVETKDRFQGSFSGTFAETTETKDGLAVGVYYIQILTSAHPQGGLRGHFFNDQTSNAPEAPAFSGAAAEAEVEVRDVPALLEITWDPAPDSEGSPVTYIYQVSRTPDFAELLIDEYVGRERVFRGLTQSEWLEFLDGQPRVTLYQRVISSDGQNVVVGPATAFELVAATGPIEGQITIPTPNYEYQGVFATLGAGFRVYDIAIDEATGRVWACTLSHGPYVYNPDGSIHKFNDPALRYGIDEFGKEFINGFDFGSASFNDGTCYGVEYDAEGYVYLAVDGDVFKLDAFTGKPVAYWDSASGFGFETNPSLADDGRLFGHDVFPGNRGFIIQPSLIDPAALSIVREFTSVSPPQLIVSGGVSRSSAFSPEGNRIYLPPTSSSQNVAIYSSTDGLDWVREPDYLMPAPTGSDAIVAGSNDQMWVINEKSAFPPNLIYVDFRNQFTWNLFLEQIEESDLRGFTISRDGRTFYVGGAQALYKWELVEDGTVQDPPLLSLTQATAIDAAGNALRAGQRVRVQAIVTTPNLSTFGLEFYGEDPVDEIRFFAGSNELGYTPAVGDKIEVTGIVQQSLGQISVVPETLEVQATGQPLRLRQLVAGFGEADESKVVMIAGLSLANPADWSNDGFLGFDATAQGTLCGVANASSIQLFIDRETMFFDKPAPTGCFTAIGVVQQRGEGFVLTPFDDRSIAIEGAVDVASVREFAPGTGELAVYLASPRGGGGTAGGPTQWPPSAGSGSVQVAGLGKPSAVKGLPGAGGVPAVMAAPESAYTWDRNGFHVRSKHVFQAANGRVFTSRSLNPGDLLRSVVKIDGGDYPFTSPFVVVGLGPKLVPDTTDNALGATIEIEFEPNLEWARRVTSVEVDGVRLDETLYSAGETRLVLAAEVFQRTGIFAIVVRAEGYEPVAVSQEILKPAPELVADATENDLLTPIEITFVDDAAWRNAATAVRIDGATLDPAVYSFTSGKLTIASGIFPGVGPHVVTVLATGYPARSVEQSIVLSFAPALVADTTENELGQLIDITFASNPIWQSFVTTVLVNEEPLAPSEYVLGDGVLTLLPAALPQVRDYVVVVLATNFSDTSVIQPVLAQGAPVLVADTEGNDIFSPVTITFADDPAWRDSVVAVLVDGIERDPSEYTLTAGALEFVAGTFPAAGDYLVQVSAGRDYQLTEVVQNVFAPSFTVEGELTYQGGILAGVDVFLDELLQMKLEGSLADTSGNGFEPTPDNDPMTFPTDGVRGQVLDFNGTDDLVTLPDFALDGDYTIDFWLNPDVTAGSQGGWSRSFLSYYQDGANAFRFGLDSAILRASVVSDGTVIGVETTSAFAVTANEWVRMTVVVERGRRAKLYLDGVDAGSVPNGWSRGTNPGLTIGARARGEGHFDGQMDALTIWNRALTPDEIADLVATDKGPRAVTDCDGRFATEVAYERDLYLKPVLNGIVFTPDNAFLEDVREDLTQDFDGAGTLSLIVLDPLEDVTTSDRTSLTRDLTGVMRDPTDCDTVIEYSLGTVSDSAFAGAQIVGTELTVDYLETYGRSGIEIVGTANGLTATDAFTVELDPYCAAQGGGDWEHIINVRLTNGAGTVILDQDSGRAFYTNVRHDAEPAVALGDSLTLRVAGQDWPSDEVLAWIDWNHDGDFDDAGESYLVGSGLGPEDLGTNRGAWSTTITVPSNAVPGKTLVRIRHHDAGASGANATPCGTASFGEVEDYSIDVQP